MFTFCYKGLGKLAAVICLLAFCSLTWAEVHYAAIVDVGSSGSRIYLYQYQIDDAKQLANISLLSSKEIIPGLSSFADDVADVDHYILPLITFAKQTLDPKTPENTVSFYLMATAGMRLLSQEQQSAIYTEVTNTVKANSQFNIGAIETITGQYEGLYDWLATNYLNHSLIPQQTVGIMDMGGASTEIAFAADDTFAPDDILKIHMGSNVFKVYSISYLAIGQDQARNQYDDDANCFPLDYPLPDGQKGTGEYSKCVTDVASLITNVHKVQQVVTHIPEQMKIFAISAFYYLASSKPFGLPNSFSAYDLQTKGTRFCAANWKKLKKQYGNDPYLFNYCFSSAYFYQLLTSGYGFGRLYNFIDTNTIANQPLDWPLGALLYLIYNQKSNVPFKITVTTQH